MNRDSNVPPDALARLEAVLQRAGAEPGKGNVRDRWLHALAWVDALGRGVDAVRARNKVLERRLRMMLEVGEGAAEATPIPSGPTDPPDTETP